MTTVRMIPTHEVVRRAFPRPPPQEKDLIAMATGLAIDNLLSECGYQLRLGRRPTQTWIAERARALLDDALAAAPASLPEPARAETLARIQEVVRAYRRSEIAGLTRPRTRAFVVNGSVGVYAQPDYWDGRHRFFEMKSFRAIPPPPDVALQLRLFQLAFSGFDAVLVCLNRHTSPVEVLSMVLPPLTPEELVATLTLAYRFGSEGGEAKVLEYIEGPIAHYTLDTARATGDPAVDAAASGARQAGG